MKARNVLFGAALVISTAAITTQVVSQDKGKGDKAKNPMPQMTPEQQEMMKKWMDFATPGENHKLLASKEGKWADTVKMWEQPGQEPDVSSGTSEFKMIMEGRYLSDTTEGSFMNQPFHGHGLAGYDNLKKKFFSVWIDSMGTGLMVAEGSYDAGTKTFKYTTQTPDVLTGKYVPARSVEKIIDNDHWTMEMYGPDKSGKEFKTLEINYTRLK